jgi:hypothetical protein
MNKLAFFILGAVTGAVITYFATKPKYEVIESEPETEETGEDDIDEGRTPTEEDIREASKILKKCQYHTYSNGNKTKKEIKKEDEKMDEDRPYVISPDEAGDEYELVSLNYYQDGVLTDGVGEVFTDEEIEQIIGKDSLKTFGQYEEDCVYVRNDMFATDYAVIADDRTWKEIIEDE